MALFTGRGDDGTTGAFNHGQRFTKGSELVEALGTVDELNSLLGFIKVKSKKIEVLKISLPEFLKEIQQNLFIIQAELAGAEKTIDEKKVIALSEIINEIEKEIPPISSFFISGGVELAAMFDFARTVARRAERRVVSAYDKNNDLVSKNTLAYLNRLSSLLYALARLYNHKSGINEEAPNYK